MCKIFPHPVTEADLLSVLFCAMFGASNVIGGVCVSDLEEGSGFNIALIRMWFNSCLGVSIVMSYFHLKGLIIK